MRKMSLSLREYCIQNNCKHLIDEFVSTNTYTPDSIGYDSTINIVWMCSYGHVETESPHKRVRRGYCSVCGPKRNGSFAQNYPDLLELWSPDNSVNPDKIPPTYTPLLKWRCEHGHEWMRRISTQLKVGNCPVCAKNKNSLFALAPELLDEWDYEKNINIPPDTIPAYSNNKYFWKCKNGHSYSAAPEKLMRRKARCPICSSFGFQNPEAAKEWHPTKNVGTPFDYAANSQKTAWFICPKCKEEYESRIAYRASRLSPLCPKCRNKN